MRTGQDPVNASLIDLLVCAYCVGLILWLLAIPATSLDTGSRDGVFLLLSQDDGRADHFAAVTVSYRGVACRLDHARADCSGAGWPQQADERLSAAFRPSGDSREFVLNGSGLADEVSVTTEHGDCHVKEHKLRIVATASSGVALESCESTASPSGFTYQFNYRPGGLVSQQRSPASLNPCTSP